MIKLKMENYNTILKGKQQKLQHYHPEKLIEMNILGEEILPSNQSRITEQVKFRYSALGKAFEKQTKANKEQGKNKLKL